MESKKPTTPPIATQPPSTHQPSSRERESTPIESAADLAAAVDMVRLAGDYSHPPRRRRILLPILLFAATCASTFWTGAVEWNPLEHIDGAQRAIATLQAHWGEETFGAVWSQVSDSLLHDWRQGLIYMGAVLGILLTHEMGHFLLALRNRIPASLPYFIPVPILPFGTMGAVIGMQGSKADRRQLFDLGVAGPLAGLAVAMPLIWIGILQLDATVRPNTAGMPYPSPLIFRILIDVLRPDFATPGCLYANQFNPLLMAGWVGMLVTGLNTLPISQLDGGHVGYALLGRRFNPFARALLVAVILFVVILAQYVWVLMLVLVILIGVDHPPTADDRVRLGWCRRTIGWAAMTIPILCIPPMRIGEVTW
ncbi:MAG: site-2 protease family protein [Thermoguttaceae bacterium]